MQHRAFGVRATNCVSAMICLSAAVSSLAVARLLARTARQQASLLLVPANFCYAYGELKKEAKTREATIGFDTPRERLCLSFLVPFADERYA